MAELRSTGAGLLRGTRLQTTLLLLFGAVVIFVAAPAFFPNRAPLGLLLEGAELGAVNGLLAIGLVLTYRANRVINFSYGAMGGLAGTFGAMLYLGQHWNWFLSLGLGLVLGGVLGVGVDKLLRWRFAKAPRLVVMVATIGLSQVFGGIQGFVPGWLHGPTLLGAFSTPLSRFHVIIRPVLFDGNDLLVVAVLLVVPAALTFFLLRTDAGIAIRSLAENPDRARLLGIPAKRLSTLVWVIAGVLAALTVLVNGPSQGVTSTVLAGPTLLLPALAAGVIARMESLPVAFGSAVGIGLVNSVVEFNVRQVAVTDVVLLGVILVTLLAQRHRRQKGGDDSVWLGTGVARSIPAAMRRLPEVRVGRYLLAAIAAGVMIAIPLIGGPGTTLEYTTAICLGFAALSLVVLSGWSGSVSLGQFAFAGVGGVVAGDLIEKTNADFFQCLVVAAAAGAVLAVIIGLPALRVRGEFLAVTSLALAVCVNSFFLNPTNFPSAIPDQFIRPLIFGRIDLTNNRVYYFFCLILLVIAALFVMGLRHARSGRVFQAARDNLEAAEAMSVPTIGVRLTAFTLAGALAGLGGALYVTTLQSVGYNSFDPSLSLLVFSMAVIGGMSSIGGSLLGVLVIEAATYKFPEYQALIAGSGLLVILLVLPGGLAEGLNRLRDVLLRLIARRRQLDVPSLMGSRAPAPRAPSVAAAGVAMEGTVLERTSTAMLDCRAVQASYGPVQILFGVDLAVEENEIVALLGTNGAGKSTLLRTITGLMDLGGGTIHMAGQSVGGSQPEDMARLGVSIMPGGRGVFPSLSVEENLRLATWLIRKDEARAAASRSHLLEMFPALAGRLDQAAGSLSGGEQQMLSLAMALTVTPRLLLIDELSLGLAPAVVGQLMAVVRRLHDEGMTIVVVEQSINVALELAQRVVFMEKGEVRFSGPASGLLDRTDLLRSVFIEGDHSHTATPGSPPRVATPAGASRPALHAVASADEEDDRVVVLECQGVTKRFGGVSATRQVHLRLHQGEIVGLIGHNGAGKTTLMDLISGFLPLDEGAIRLGRLDVGWMPPYQRAREGVGRTFQEARLFPSLTVRETIAVAMERHLASRGVIAAGMRLPASLDSEYLMGLEVDGLIDLMGLGDFAERLAGELSTGTRRILELACVMAQGPRVLLLDEPSAGVAQRETEAMGPLLKRVQRQTGCSILVIEHDMPLLSAICDRLVALELGEIIAEGLPSDVLAHPRVIASYLGLDEVSINRSGTPGVAAVPLTSS